MTRADRGIERLDYNTYEVLLGGLGNTPEDVGINVKKFYVAPRLGAIYRLDDDTVLRAGYGRTFNPLPWSRPMRGSFPLRHLLQPDRGAVRVLRTLEHGHPAGADPGPQLRPRAAAARRLHALAQPERRGPRHHPADERRLRAAPARATSPRRSPTSHTRTDGGYADLNINYSEPGRRQRGAQVLRAGRHHRDHRLGVADQEPLPRPPGRGQPSVQERPAAEGRLHPEPLEERDATTKTAGPASPGTTRCMLDQNFALAGFDRTARLPDGLRLRAAVREGARTSSLGRIVKNWQINGIGAAYSGTPFSIAGTNPRSTARAADGFITSTSAAIRRRPARRVANRALVPARPIFSQPTGADVEGFGNSRRNQFRRPGVWNVDLGLFRSFPIGRFRPEFRIEATNVFNHTNWGRPVVAFTANNFMQFTPQSTVVTDTNNALNTPGPRRIQIGLRTQF